MTSSQKCDSYVYFVKPIGLAGPIKIGCSQTPDARLDAINVWCPFRLELLASIPGTYDLERKLHRCFSEFHSHGEWFSANDRLAEGIKAIQRGVAVEDAFDLSVQGKSILTGKRRVVFTPEYREKLSFRHRINHARHRLNRTTGTNWIEPKMVDEILVYNKRKNALSQSDKAFLTAVLANPHLYFARLETKESAAP